MLGWMRRRVQSTYEQLLLRGISRAPTHVAVIQDGNRRYANQHGEDATNGHREGAKTTERVLNWCEQLDIEELTLYAFSTENFNRPEHERESLFDLLEEKLYEFADADRIHENDVAIRTIGDTGRLPERVTDAVRYAEEQTSGHDNFVLNIALAYGGRAELLRAARDVAHTVEDGELRPEDIDIAEIEQRLYDRPIRDVDLIIRTGGDERTSNFLPWHANGNEAAVFFCAPYWPEFSKIDFLRGIRTYNHRQQSWQQARVRRAIELLRAFGHVELDEAKSIVRRFREHLPRDRTSLEETDVEDSETPTG